MAVSTKTYAVIAATVAAVALVGTWAGVRFATDDPFADCRTSAIAGGMSAVGGAFTLTDENGAVVTDKDVLKGPSLVYFGYTFCPDICPADNGRNAEAVDELERMGFEVTPVFISVDPARDTPERLKEWTDYLHPRMIGLTGTPEQIRSVAQAYKTIYRVPENPEDDYYLVDHMTQTYFMLPGIGLADFYGREVTAEEMAKSVACFLRVSA